MKILIKLLIVLGVSAPLATSAVVYSVNKANETAAGETKISPNGDYYQLKNDIYTMQVDRFNLQFTITDGKSTWDSGRANPDDETTPLSRLAFIEDAATIYCYTPSGAESSFSIFDSVHRSTTTKTFRVKDNKLYADIGVMHGGSRKEPDFKFSFTITYCLEDDGLSISVSDLNEEGSKNTLSKLAIYPGFAASYQLNDGYFLIPDGSGALIDLSKPTHAQSALTLTTYGKDIGISTVQRSYTSSEILSMPMYAIYDKTKMAMITLEEGAEYSNLNSKVSGIIDPYNFTYFDFVFKEMTYQYQGISESTRKAVPQKEANKFNPKIHYHLHSGEFDYSSIAKKYREYLFNKSLLQNIVQGESKIRLEFLMAENKKALFGNTVFKMTSASFIKEKANSLLSLGNKFTYSVRGYTRGGYGNSYPYSFPLEGKSGSYDDYINLATFLKEKGMDLNYTVDLLRSFNGNGVNSGVLATNMSQKLINTSDYVNGTNITFNRLTPNNTSKLLSDYNKELENLKGSGFNFTSIGSDLFSTYFNEQHTRSDAMNIYQNALSLFGKERNLRKPNLYLWNYLSSYLDAPYSSSNFMVETESIPFLQMVLSGYTSFYSSPINLNYLGNRQLLQLVDFNINPTYLLTELDTMELIDSPSSSYIYSSLYDTWEKDIINAYQKVIMKLSSVSGKEFISRTLIAPNVYLNKYSSGKAIIVNYGFAPYTYSGIEVKGNESEVIDYE